MSKEKEIRKYLEDKVDVYLKPLLLDLMKEQPTDVYTYLVNWVAVKGKDIRDSINAQNQVHQSTHYEEFKQSVIEVQPPQIEDNPVQEENPAPQVEGDAPQDPPTEPAPQE